MAIVSTVQFGIKVARAAHTDPGPLLRLVLKAHHHRHAQTVATKASAKLTMTGISLASSFKKPNKGTRCCESAQPFSQKEKNNAQNTSLVESLEKHAADISMFRPGRRIGRPSNHPKLLQLLQERPQALPKACIISLSRLRSLSSSCRSAKDGLPLLNHQSHHLILCLRVA